MSQDVIGGISVIQRSRFWSQAPIYRVSHILHHADGRRGTICLCMTEGPTEPPGVAEIAGEPVWQFIKGLPGHGWIACHPSVRQFVTVEGVQRDLFHNAYDWQVQYVEMRWQEPDIGQQPCQIERYDVLLTLNNPELSDAERAAKFAEFRQHGVIY